MGRLSVGAILEATYQGQRHTAEVLQDGQISYAGTAYKSLSAAGGAMVLALKQPRVARAGREDWKPRHAEGDPPSSGARALNVARSHFVLRIARFDAPTSSVIEP
jgi:hypothetical protein